MDDKSLQQASTIVSQLLTEASRLLDTLPEVHTAADLIETAKMIKKEMMQLDWDRREALKSAFAAKQEAPF